MKKIFRFIRFIITIVLLGTLVYGIYYTYNYPDKMLESINNFWYEHFDSYLIIDDNEKNNYKELLKSGKVKNRDYIDSEFYPYFALLNESQQQVYYDIIEGANEYKEYITPSRKIQVDDVKDIYYAVMYDHPELFWLNSKYSYDYYHDTNEVIKITMSYTMPVENIPSNRVLFDTEINKIIDVAKTYELDYEKEKYVHDSLVNLITYDETYKDDQSAFNAMINHRAVCAGYAKAFQIIMTKLGVPTYYITGEANGDHAWNLILLDDGYYNVDLTWDDQEDRIIYKYYNVSEEMITKDHSRKELSIRIVKAEGSKYINKYSTLGE